MRKHSKVAFRPAKGRSFAERKTTPCASRDSRGWLSHARSVIARRSLAGLFLLAFLVTPSPEDRVRAAEPASVRVVKAEPAAEWNLRFAGNEGWIGGDGVYSAELGRQRILWLFGDTLIGKVTDGRRAGAAFVNNTVGILSRETPDAPIRFATGKSKDGTPSAVFIPIEGGGWFWPQAPIYLRDRLFVFLAQIEKTDQAGPFGFKQIGQWLAVIDNPLEGPTSWRVDQRRVPFAEFSEARELSWGSALVADPAHVYIYGTLDRRQAPGSRQLLVARSAVDKLADFSTWQFRAADGWSDVPTEAEPLASGLATEFSVSPLPNGSGYIAVYTENGLSDHIVGRTSTSPHGPWSEPVLLCRCPEMSRDKGVFSYAAKAHPWAVDGHELLISYCMNTWDFARLFADNAVYRPQFVRVSFEQAR